MVVLHTCGWKVRGGGLVEKHGGQQTENGCHGYGLKDACSTWSSVEHWFMRNL